MLASAAAAWTALVPARGLKRAQLLGSGRAMPAAHAACLGTPPRARSLTAAALPCLRRTRRAALADGQRIADTDKFVVHTEDGRKVRHLLSRCCLADWLGNGEHAEQRPGASPKRLPCHCCRDLAHRSWQPLGAARPAVRSALPVACDCVQWKAKKVILATGEAAAGEAVGGGPRLWQRQGGGGDGEAPCGGGACSAFPCCKHCCAAMHCRRAGPDARDRGLQGFLGARHLGERAGEERAAAGSPLACWLSRQQGQ